MVGEGDRTFVRHINLSLMRVVLQRRRLLTLINFIYASEKLDKRLNVNKF